MRQRCFTCIRRDSDQPSPASKPSHASLIGQLSMHRRSPPCCTCFKRLASISPPRKLTLAHTPAPISRSRRRLKGPNQIRNYTDPSRTVSDHPLSISGPTELVALASLPFFALCEYSCAYIPHPEPSSGTTCVYHHPGYTGFDSGSKSVSPSRVDSALPVMSACDPRGSFLPGPVLDFPACEDPVSPDSSHGPVQSWAAGGEGGRGGRTSAAAGEMD